VRGRPRGDGRLTSPPFLSRGYSWCLSGGCGGWGGCYLCAPASPGGRGAGSRQTIQEVPTYVSFRPSADVRAWVYLSTLYGGGRRNQSQRHCGERPPITANPTPHYHRKRDPAMQHGRKHTPRGGGSRTPGHDPPVVDRLVVAERHARCLRDSPQDSCLRQTSAASCPGHVKLMCPQSHSGEGGRGVGGGPQSRRHNPPTPDTCGGSPAAQDGGGVWLVSGC